MLTTILNLEIKIKILDLKELIKLWLNAFQKGEKSLSPIELLILAMVPEKFSSPKLITEILFEKTQEWVPTSGTVYPILHRLESRGLLEKTGKSRLQFRKSNGGKIFLSTLLKPLQAQTRESNQFYLTIIKSILEVSPMPIGLKEFMENLAKDTKEFSLKISELTEEAMKLKDDSVDVPIKFE